MKRDLPIFSIAGTDFLVDVTKPELREKTDPENTISFFEMHDLGNGYLFDYRPKDKNIAPLFSDDEENLTIRLPQLVELDPVGMAAHYGKTLAEMQGKSDFEIMIDQLALQQRLQGKLTTIEIAGHLFYVDIRMDKLRPKDDFFSKGIVFSEVDHYYFDKKEAYLIPYNPATHEFQEINYDAIKAFPEDLIAIEFPHERMMDPVGVNRKGGWDDLFELKETPVKAHFIAKIVDWKDTDIRETIKENLTKEAEKQKRIQQEAPKQSRNRKLRKGRGI